MDAGNVIYAQVVSYFGTTGHARCRELMGLTLKMKGDLVEAALDEYRQSRAAVLAVAREEFYFRSLSS